jgi:8-oxo-dGTP pyrophosphatase MutT (NUDIX family)
VSRRRRRGRGRGGKAAVGNAASANAANGATPRGARPAGKRRNRGRARVHRERSAGGVVVRDVGGTTRVLLIRDPYGHWGFPKGHLERGERPDAAALREVMEETGLRELTLVTSVKAIEWRFRFRGKLIQKHCEFFLMETAVEKTSPQRSEGITACKWAGLEEADTLIGYENARGVLTRARELLAARAPGAAVPSLPSPQTPPVPARP